MRHSSLQVSEMNHRWWLFLVLCLAGCGRGAGERLPDANSVNPMAARQPAPDGSTKLFSPLSVEETGVDFITQWDKPAAYDRVFYSQNTGGGVTIGDYDQDGLPDLFFSRPSGGGRLYRNQGKFRFQDVTEAAGLRDDEYWNTGASFVDIDNDGDLDLYLCAYGSPNRLYLNDGQGKFQFRVDGYGLNFNGASVMMAFSDYDRDGDLDGYLVTAGLPPGPNQQFRVKFVNGRPVVLDELVEYWQLLYLPGDRAKQVEAGQFDRLFRNDGKDAQGNWKFTEVGKESGLQGADIGQAAVWWDYNQDGLPDLYVSNDYWGPDRLYRNLGNGKFQDDSLTSLPHTPWSSMGIDIGDINRDGLMDLMATDMAGSNHFRQKVGMGDMSSSGWFLEFAEPRQYSRNTVFINTGTPRFMEVAFMTGLQASDWTWTPRFEDLDNDGWEDVFITNGMTRDFTNSDLNDIAKQKYKEGTPEFFAFWRQQDLRRDKNMMLRNLGDLRFEDVGEAWGFDHVGVSFGAGTADLDLDGDLDLVLNNMDRPAQIYRNNSTQGNSVRVQLVGTRSNRQALGAVVRARSEGIEQVRYLTLSRGWSSTSEPVLHFGLGDARQVDEMTIEWPSGTVQTLSGLSAGHLHRVEEPDGQATTKVVSRELTPPNGSAEMVSTLSAKRVPRYRLSQALARVEAKHKEKPFDDYQLQPLLPSKLSQLGPGVACADIDGDGREDYYLGGAAGQPGQLAMRVDDGFELRVDRAFRQDAECEDMGAVFFDADQDGDQDLYVVSGSNEFPADDPRLQDRLYRNDDGDFLRDTDALPEMRTSGSVVTAGDYDRDGDLDLFVGGRFQQANYPLAPRSYLLRNDQGRFTDVTASLNESLGQGGMVTSATWIDVDDDGWLDLWVTQEWGAVRAFRNEHGQSLREMTNEYGLASLLGWWNGIRAADLDHDGDLDFVVTNFGLNTKYHASSEHPTSIYYGDFDQSGKMQIVESEYEGDKLFPVRGRSCSSNAMPILRERFKTFSDFGVAQLQDIYTEKCLENAHKFDANVLESGVLWQQSSLSDVDGQISRRFEFKPFPRIAQVAPAFGVEVLDANRDGHQDVYLVQNFYSPQRETGHMDGGVSLLMLGDGKGNWQAVWPGDSGLAIGADAKSLAVTDFNQDGWLDFLVGINNQTWQAWECVVDDSQKVGENEPLESATNSGDHLRRKAARSLHLRLQMSPGNLTGVGTRVMLRWEGQSTTSERRDVTAGGGYLSQATPILDWTVPEATDGGELLIYWPDGKQSKQSFEFVSGEVTKRLDVKSP